MAVLAVRLAAIAHRRLSESRGSLYDRVSFKTQETARMQRFLADLGTQIAALAAHI